MEINGDQPLNFKQKIRYLLFNLVRGLAGPFVFLNMKSWRRQKIEPGLDSPARKYIDGFLAGNISRLRLPQEAKILDIGCGSGYVRKIFYDSGYKLDYTGLDIKKDDNFEKLSRYSARSRFICSRIEDFITEEKYDLILSVSALEHVENDQLAISKGFEFLKVGGVQVHIIPAFSSLFLYLWHGFRQYNPRRIKKLFQGVSIKIYKLGGFFSFLLHLSVITILEIILRRQGLRRLKGYLAAVNIANKLDYFLPFCPAFYAVIAEREKTYVTAPAWSIRHYFYIFSYTGANRVKVFLNIIQLLFYKLIKKKEAVKEINGSTMLLDLSRPGISKILFICNKRELLNTGIIKQEVKGDMNVLDIGANIGYYALLEASLLDRKGKVYAFEPDPRNAELLKRNIVLNNFEEKIKFFPCAVAEENCFRNFKLNKQTNLSSFTRGGAEKIANVETRCVKLDDLPYIDQIDFVRMDVEGYECMVVAGMMEFLKRKNNLKMQIEIHPAAFNIGKFRFPEQLKELEALGFKVKSLITAASDRPRPIIDKGYKLVKSVREGKWRRGLYENIKMDDLIDFLKRDPKIVRSIFLEKNNENTPF